MEKAIGRLLGPGDRPPGHGSDHDIDVSDDEYGTVFLRCVCGFTTTTTRPHDTYKLAERHWASPSGLWIP